MKVFQIRAAIRDECVECPNCGRQVRVSEKPARVYGECVCGAAIEVEVTGRSRSISGITVEMVLSAKDYYEIQSLQETLQERLNVEDAKVFISELIDARADWIWNFNLSAFVFTLAERFTTELAPVLDKIEFALEALSKRENENSFEIKQYKQAINLISGRGKDPSIWGF